MHNPARGLFRLRGLPGRATGTDAIWLATVSRHWTGAGRGEVSEVSTHGRAPALAKPPNNWDHDTTFHNILEKLTAQQVAGLNVGSGLDHGYEFEPGLIDEPEKYDINGLTPPGTLSPADKQWALKWYPPLQAALATLQPFQPVALDLAAGQQVDFAIKPTASRKYRIETKGASDTLLVLFEDINGTPRYLSGDDDSGEDRNASITYKVRRESVSP